MANIAATPDNTPSNATKSCIVCGLGSHRSDWINKSGEFVACDHHSAEEVSAAVKAHQANEPKPTPKTLTPGLQAGVGAAAAQKPQPTQAPTTASVPSIGGQPNTPKTNTPTPDAKTGTVGSASPSAPTPPTPIRGAASPAIAPKPTETKAKV